MGCKNYSHKLFNFVESWRVQSPTFDDFKIWLNDFFKEEDYNAILEAIEDGTWNEEFRKSFTPGQDASLVIKSLDDDGFLEEKSPSPNIMSLYQDPIYGGSIAMNRTIREFEDEIVKRLIYDQEHRKGIDTSIVLPNGVSIVNHKLIAFKKELLQKLWNITGIDRSGNYNSDEEFTQMVNLTLKDFEFLLMSRSDEYIDAYGDYIKLKAFDTLLKGLDFVVIKDAYKNSRFIGANMYDYRGPQMKRDASIGKETAEISDYTGSVIKLLLKNCFRRIKKVNGQSKPGAFITEVSFNRAMTEVIKWYMYEDGAYIDPSGYEKLLSGDKDLDYGSLIDIYLANHTSRTMYQSIIESILNGAREQIFSRDSGLTSYIMGCFQRHLQDVFSQVYLQYGENINTKAVENKVTTDYFVELQSNNIENIVRIQSRSWKPYLKKRDTEVKGAFQDVLKKHNIQINGEAKTVTIDGHVYSLTGNKVKDSNSLVYTIKSETPRSSSPITDEIAIELIRDVLGIEITEDYQSIVEGMDPERSLMSIFEGAIVLTLASASDEFDFITYKKSKLLNTFYYRNILQPVAVYLSEVYGEDSINVIKNTEGNALPLYSLGSLSKKLRRVINSLQDSSVAQYNPVVALPELLKREYVRSQTKIGDVIKDSKNLGPSEIMAVQQLNDFWLNLTKTSENPTIKVMPMTLSDKSTHTLYEINLNAYQIKGKSLAVYLKGIGTNGASDNVKKILQNEFSEREGLKIKQQLINIVSAYASVYKFDFNEDQAKDDLSYLKIKIDYVNGILKTKKSVNQVKTDFGQNRFVDVYYCDFDFEGSLSINPQLLYEADIHLFKTIKFDEVVRDNEIDFIEDMRANRFKINKTLYPDVTVVGKDWYDPIANVIEPFLIYDENGDVIKDHTKEIDWTKCTFKLHPVMEAYFYANMLINVPLQEVMLGATYAYKSFVQTRDNKKAVIDSLNVVSRWTGDSELTLDSSYEEIIERRQRLVDSGIIDRILSSNDVDKKIALNKLIVKVGDSYDFKISSLLEVKDGEIFYDRLDKKAFYQQSMSLKLNDKMKRALIVGATITSPVLDKPYCPPRQVNIAICKDFYGFAFNLSGKSNNKEPHDGSGWTSPYFSRAVNFGLFDGAVGKNKKTIGGYLDPDTLIFKEIKWAEFELSNQYRKRSFDESEMSAEVMFKKMHDRTISKAEMNKLDISHFYGKQIHKSKFYNSTITHTEDIYFFNPEDGNYYKILDVMSDGNTCTRTIIRVDLNGNHIGETITKDIPINSIYDLDQVFGGCFCKKLSSDGVLVDSDANSDIVYNIISENEWWDYIVHIVTNTSAFKTGVENVNEVATSKLDKYNNNRTSIFSRYDDTVLKTIKYDISNYGAIMDADHELDKSDNSVKEMGQVIAALIQEGASIDTVNEIYSAIGKLAYASMSDLIEAHERFLHGDKEKLVLELGKAVIEAFESRSQNNIALAYAFLDSFSQNINMPFSSHAVSGVVLSSLGSKLTKLSLKTTYPGIGTVQVPSNGIMKYYEYYGKRYDYEGIVKELHRRKIPINDLYNVGTFTEEIVDEDLVVTPSNKTLLSSNPMEINFEDTIVIYDAVTKTSSVIKISDVTTRDYYRNRFDWRAKAMFKWSVKSKDLLPQITKFTFNGERYTAWDLTSYRAAAYATSLLDPEKFTTDDLVWMQNWLTTNFGITGFSEEVLKPFITEQNRIFKETLDELSRIQKGEITSLTQDPFFTTVTNVKTDAAQIILGKRFMKQFGLRKGDDLSKITSSAFFVNRLTQQYALPSRAEVSSDIYDAVLYTKNGEQILVTISDQDDPRLAGTTLYTGETLALRGDKVWYNNEEELNISKNTKIRSKIINGKEYIILAVNSLDELKTLKHSSMTSMIRYNYNESNVRGIMSYEYDFDWDSDDVVDFNAFDLRSIGLEKGDIISISNLTQLSNSDLTTLMRKIERDRIVSNIKDLAESRFVAFKKSLEAIGARIPAQSMQSFMSLEVVGFTESDVNDIYVPFTLTWVAGSDYKSIL